MRRSPVAIPERVARVSEACKEALSEIVRDEIKDPRLGFATITAVEMTADLRKARVWVSFLGQPEEREQGLQVLRKAKPHIRGELGKRVRLKFVPELEFHEDNTAEKGLRIEHIIKELNQE